MLRPELLEWTPVLKKKHRYGVELKAWIPHRRVADPIPKPGSSPYHGDGHVGYDGWHRVLN